ncbi:MAG: class I SAM-dependent methyltransferase [Lachnospiraceae bacterium]|jgi:SAM-dependent methyltransferase|nr:class I SAM-dependent methyltransferase [Lachnospiraceae bacterium]
MEEGSVRMEGGVKLDYSKYPGEDFYCDGKVEEELLDEVKNNPPEAFSEIIARRKDWPTLYHLSPFRGNIVSWIPFTGREKVLEIGSGPGAVTAALAGRVRSVTCVDLSSVRSMINACRNRAQDNITIHVGNFADIEPDLDTDYDYIFLIGVLEYARSYINDRDAFRLELRRILPHLKKAADGNAEGRLFIAIENRLGLKYFAGCREDHSQKYFDGITNYENHTEDRQSCAQTFTRPVLEEMLRSCGVRDLSFYYPYPDYKFTSSVFSDRRLPAGAELCDNIRNFDRDRLLLFDEKQAYDGIVQDGLFPLFSNSFGVMTGKPLPAVYARFSNDRAPAYRTMTEILEAEDGTRTVRKTAADPAAKAHVAHMQEAAEHLAARYGQAQGALQICPCILQEDGSVLSPYISGTSLESLLDERLAEGDAEGFYALIKEYVGKAGANAQYPASDPDMTFFNILADGDRWTAIDCEWEEDTAMPAEELLARALRVYFDASEKRRVMAGAELEKRFGITESDLEKAGEAEERFQNKVAGGRITLGPLRAMMGKDVTVPEEIIREDPVLLERALAQEEERGVPQPEKPELSLSSVQVYYDTGAGFSEETSFFLEEQYGDEGKIAFSLEVPEDARSLRVDPAICPCFVLPGEFLFNGTALPAFRRQMKCNGRMQPDGSIVFTTSDPQMIFDLEQIRRAAKQARGKQDGTDCVSMEIQMCGMPVTMAEAMERNRK